MLCKSNYSSEAIDFWCFAKNVYYHFTSQKRSQRLWKILCWPLSKGGKIKICNVHKIHQKYIISITFSFPTQYYHILTMGKGLVVYTSIYSSTEPIQHQTPYMPSLNSTLIPQIMFQLLVLVTKSVTRYQKKTKNKFDTIVKIYDK